jgi:hypothetical protein
MGCGISIRRDIQIISVQPTSRLKMEEIGEPQNEEISSETDLETMLSNLPLQENLEIPEESVDIPKEEIQVINAVTALEIEEIEDEISVDMPKQEEN